MLISAQQIEYQGFWFWQEHQEMTDGYFWNKTTGEIIKDYQCVSPGLYVVSFDQALLVIAGLSLAVDYPGSSQYEVGMFCRRMESFVVAPSISTIDGLKFEPTAAEAVKELIPAQDSHIPF